MSLWAHLLAGGAQGYGSGIQRQGEADARQRERAESRAHDLRMTTLRDELARARAEEDREWRSEFRAEGWEHQKGVTAEQREHDAGLLAEQRSYDEGIAERDRGWKLEDEQRQRGQKLEDEARADARALSQYKDKLELDYDYKMKDPAHALATHQAIEAIRLMRTPQEARRVLEEIRSKPVKTYDDEGNEVPLIGEDGRPVMMEEYVEKFVQSPRGDIADLMAEVDQFQTDKYGVYYTSEKARGFYEEWTSNGSNLQPVADYVRGVVAQSEDLTPETLLQIMSSSQYGGMQISRDDQNAILELVSGPRGRVSLEVEDVTGQEPEGRPPPSEPNEGVFGAAGAALSEGAETGGLYTPQGTIDPSTIVNLGAPSTAEAAAAASEAPGTPSGERVPVGAEEARMVPPEDAAMVDPRQLDLSPELAAIVGGDPTGPATQFTDPGGPARQAGAGVFGAASQAIEQPGTTQAPVSEPGVPAALRAADAGSAPRAVGGVPTEPPGPQMAGEDAQDFDDFYRQARSQGGQLAEALRQIRRAPPEAVMDALYGGDGAGASLVDDVQQVASSFANWAVGSGRILPEDMPETMARFMAWLEDAHSGGAQAGGGREVTGRSFLEHVLSGQGATVRPLPGNLPQALP